ERAAVRGLHREQLPARAGWLVGLGLLGGGVEPPGGCVDGELLGAVLLPRGLGGALLGHGSISVRRTWWDGNACLSPARGSSLIPGVGAALRDHLVDLLLVLVVVVLGHRFPLSGLRWLVRRPRRRLPGRPG